LLCRIPSSTPSCSDHENDECMIVDSASIPEVEEVCDERSSRGDSDVEYKYMFDAIKKEVMRQSLIDGEVIFAEPPQVYHTPEHAGMCFCAEWSDGDRHECEGWIYIGGVTHPKKGPAAEVAALPKCLAGADAEDEEENHEDENHEDENAEDLEGEEEEPINDECEQEGKDPFVDGIEDCMIIDRAPVVGDICITHGVANEAMNHRIVRVTELAGTKLLAELAEKYTRIRINVDKVRVLDSVAFSQRTDSVKHSLAHFKLTEQVGSVRFQVKALTQAERPIIVRLACKELDKKERQLSQISTLNTSVITAYRAVALMIDIDDPLELVSMDKSTMDLLRDEKLRVATWEGWARMSGLAI
jgi:hypothetical protein